MNTDTQAAARELLNTVQDNVLATFPSEAEYYRGFFKRFAPQLLQTVIAALDPLMTEAAERLDAAQNNRWHTLNAVSLSTQLAKADADTVQWLLSRVPAHRPDLASITNQWAQDAGISVPDHSEIERAVPAVLSGRMWLLRLSDTGVIGGVIPQAEFGRFAALAWEDEESGSGALLDAAVGWFGAAEAIERAKAQDGSLPEWKLQQQFDFLKLSSEGMADEEALRKEARHAVQVRRWLLDAAGIGIPKRHRGVVLAEPKAAPSLAEMEELLGQLRDEFKASEREASDVAAVHNLPESAAEIGGLCNTLSIRECELVKGTPTANNRPSAEILQRFPPDMNLVSSSFTTINLEQRFRDDSASVYVPNGSLDRLAEGSVQEGCPTVAQEQTGNHPSGAAEVDHYQIPRHSLNIAGLALGELIRADDDFGHFEGAELALPDRGVIGLGFENPAGQKEFFGQFLKPLLTQVGRGDDQNPPLAFCPFLRQNKTRFDGLAQADFVGQQGTFGQR